MILKMNYNENYLAKNLPDGHGLSSTSLLSFIDVELK